MREILASISPINSEHLSIRLLEDEDAPFIFDLLNTEGWIKFIGNRNINNLNDALKYIQKINGNNNIGYFLVSAQNGGEKLGLVTVIKREHYDHPDIGFAFLPSTQGKGYALQASLGLLDALNKINFSPFYIAITLPDNNKSVSLLKKLGFEYEKEQMDEDELLHVYKKEM